MNEHQAEYNPDYNSNYDSDWQQQNNQYTSSVETTNNHAPDLLNNPLQTEYSNQQADSYSQDNYQTGYVDNYNNFNPDINQQSPLYSDNLNSLYADNQLNQVLEQNQANNPLQTQEYNNSLWENAYQENSNSLDYATNLNETQNLQEPTTEHLQQVNYTHQRSGGMETINNLSKDHQIGDIISESGKEYKVVDYAPIHGGYDVIGVERNSDGTYKEQGSTNTFVPKSDVDVTSETKKN
jgi:hypothetical protein